MTAKPGNSPEASAAPLHILVVSNHWGVTDNRLRAGVFVDLQIEALRAMGHRVSTFDIGQRHSPTHLLRRLRALRAAVKELRPDVVHARYGTQVAMLSVLSGAPSIITFAGSDLLPGASVSLLRTWAGIALSNLAALKADALICVSEELRRALWWRRGSAHVIPDGVDLDLFAPGSQTEARAKLGWDHDRPTVLLNALRDPANKGLPLARAAMDVLGLQMPEAELVLTPGVDQSEMPNYYNAADLLLCASRQEGSPNVVKEALACNLPVVSVPVGDVPERLEGVEPAAIVPRDPEALADAMASILRARGRSNGRSRVLSLSLTTVAQRVVDVYRGCLDHEP